LTHGRPGAGSGIAENQMLEEPPASIGTNYGLAGPIRLRPIAHVSVQCRPRDSMLATGIQRSRAGLDEGDEPVPVQQGHVVVKVGRGMPAQEVIVVEADLAGCVVMADIVIIGLR
jgi:hypothetical protein